ncbi:hypothetical protein GFS24_17415 [Chitinophaga sp. SYP-B3965]|uniref:WD40/YVTN/BNR-like repeat-containing protein n=1 Tax=Chitinophaga sp. SYP-B3965 TaxID=2663120 RepID=UPI0012996B69|nr:hypothetical protein [Chitinophaga sp. SYP-B3965]MRG46904.1 hypothetical protein [Chitinophaga sp. SYP-B3965]
MPINRRAVLTTFILSLLSSLAFAQDGRIFLSKDSGTTWKRMDEGLPQKAVVNDLLSVKGIVLAGTQAHGLFISEDQLNTWHASNRGLPKDIKIDALEVFENRILLGSHKHGLFISNDNGKNWFPSNTGLTDSTVRCFYIYETRILAGTNNGIYISTDKGRSWRNIFPNRQINGITSLKDKLYVAGGDGVILSSNKGETWKFIYRKATVHNISSNGAYVFAMSYEAKVFKTNDDGISWLKADSGLPNQYTFQIKNIGQRLIACQWDGVYRSDNNGNNWTKSSQGLPPFKPFKELLITDMGVIASRP